MSKGRLYPIVGIANFVGICWLLYRFKVVDAYNTNPICPIKLTSGYPCPSCGSTRSILAILQGDFLQALYLNPLGYIGLALILITSTLWIIDMIRKSDTLVSFYLYSEHILKQKLITIPLIILILINWIWNITKGL